MPGEAPLQHDAIGSFRPSSTFDPALILSQISTLLVFFHLLLLVGESLVCRFLGANFELWKVWDLGASLNLTTRSGRLNILVYIFVAVVM
jgi:hypothetical protein